ncbi:substrate-binding domain-containing protein [Marmoricola sp. URHB0036]|uniref:sugar ABC transporter substrate-binding protein n=1 Tax=Marmoricola sp. URHB0036 TaxID=1298863 RepID=UPI0018CBA29E|nr:substrate-binding domain-containing protein [Marmoricola sp. URHB0036]
MKKRIPGQWSAIAAAALLVTTVSACGGSGTGSSGAEASSGDTARYKDALNAWYKGTYKEPEGPAVQAPKGKDVWLVSTGMGIEYSVRVAKAAKQAATDLGWNFHVFDAKFDPNQMLTGVQQAVVAHASGIIVSNIDCATVKNAAQQAKAAGIPIIGIESADCSPSVYSHVVSYAGKASLQHWLRDFGKAQATWVIAKTNGQAKVVLNTETDTASTLGTTVGIKEQLKQCSTCKILEDATWVSSDYGPGLQTKIQQAMVKHPDANSFIPSYDSVMTQSGGAQALKSTGRMSQLAIAGGEGSSAGIAQIRGGDGMQMCAGESGEWETYSAFDALVRSFLKRDTSEVDTGNGIQVCDKAHNMPPTGKAYTPPVDFVSAYRKLWGLS